MWRRSVILVSAMRVRMLFSRFLGWGSVTNGYHDLRTSLNSSAVWRSLIVLPNIKLTSEECALELESNKF